MTRREVCSDNSHMLNPGGGGTPLQEPNGDVPLDGVANSRILGVSRESKWEDSQLKRSESCLLN